MLNKPDAMSTADESAGASQRYAAREKRVADAIALRQPDRVPLSYMSQFWHAKYAGITNRTAMYDYEALAAAVRRVALELQPDAVVSPFGMTALGPTFELIGYRSYRWPGHGLPDDRPYQYIDHENMLGEEYDEFIQDPSWFCFTRYLPRVSDAYAPLAKLPQLAGHTSIRMPFYTANFGDPAVAAALGQIAEAGKEGMKMVVRALAFQEELKGLGFPLGISSTTTAPYDYFADYLRGSKGIMLDIYRRRDKLLEAMEKLVPMLIRDAVTWSSRSPCKIVMVPLHWGIDGFMSIEQFKSLYWPQLRKVIIGLIDNGITPLVFWEGCCDSRMEIIADVPKGKCIYWLERSDIFRAKAILGDVVCLRGGVPAAMLMGGTPAEIRDCCQKLIQVVGRGGGFMLDASVGIPAESRSENVFAMFQAVRDFGRYD